MTFWITQALCSPEVLPRQGHLRLSYEPALENRTVFELPCRPATRAARTARGVRAASGSASRNPCLARPSAGLFMAVRQAAGRLASDGPEAQGGQAAESS